MINNAVIMGRLVADPELKTTTNGLSVVRFRVAVERDYKKGNEKQTDFLSVEAWRQTAEFVCTWFHKADMIAVSGSVRADSYETKDGQKREKVYILADKVSFCGTKGKSKETAPAEDDELPF